MAAQSKSDPAGAPWTIKASMMIGVLREIAEPTSPEIAALISRVYGGGRLYIPREARPGQALSRLVGQDNAVLICQRIGGDTLEIPSLAVQLRVVDARALRAAGHSYAAIARILGISRGRVSAILRGFVAPLGLKPPEIPVCPACKRAHFPAEPLSLGSRL